MCGLSGVMSRYLSQGEVDAFRDLMVVSTLRGEQGTGVVAVAEKVKHGILEYKTLEPASVAVYNDEFHDLYKKKTAILMGHARHPTAGGSSKDNLHPFQIDHIIGMHNGTLEEVCGTKIAKGASDSRLLFSCIADLGIRETINKTRGSYALVWIDTKADTINFLRNDKRTLYFAFPANDRTTMYWSSEREMLELVLERLYGFIDVYKLNPDTWLSFRLRNNLELKYVDNQKVYQHLSMKTESQKPNTPRTSVPVVAPETPPTTSVVTATKEQVMDEMLVSFNGDKIQYGELKAVLKKGCCNCDESVTLSDLSMKRLHFTGKREFICNTCYENDPTMKGLADSYSFGQTSGAVH